MTRPNPFMRPVNKKNDWVEYLFNRITDWIENTDNPNFDSSFFDSLQEQFERKGFLTENQRIALENLYTTWVDR